MAAPTHLELPRFTPAPTRYDSAGESRFRQVAQSAIEALVRALTGNLNLPGTLTVPAITLGTVSILTGAGTPEGAVTAPVGSLFLRTNGGAATTLYVKETGVGNTGWVGK